MKIRVCFTVDLSDDDLKTVVDYAKATGHNFDDPSKRVLIRRVFETHGMDVLYSAREYYGNYCEEDREE